MANAKVSKNGADFTKAGLGKTPKKAPVSSKQEPWSDRPGASEACWNGNNLLDRTTVPAPGSSENPQTGDAADYAYGLAIGKECARDYCRSLDEVEADNDDLSETVCNLLQDSTRSDIVKRGAVAGFLDEIAVYTHNRIKAERSDLRLAQFGPLRLVHSRNE